MSQVTTVRPKPLDSASVLVISLLLVDSLHFVFARLLHDRIHPATSVLYVLAVATVQVAVFAWTQGQLRFTVLRRQPWLFVGVGFLVAASTLVNYFAVAYIDPGTAALLAQASILFGLGFGVIWLKDRLSQQQWLGVMIAFVGVAIITFQPGDYFRLGSLLVLSSSFMYALHAALVKKYAQELAPLEFFLFRLVSTTGFLLLFAASSGHLVWPTGAVWPLLILVGTVDVVISRTLYYLALRRLKMSLHSIVLTASPVVAIAWSLLLFGTQPEPRAWLGGTAVLAGLFLATMRWRNS